MTSWFARCAFVVAFLLAGSAYAQVASVSPGKLSAGHAAFETQCNRCHTPFAGVPREKCLGCHTALADRMARNLGFHSTVAQKPCTECHSDHHGRDAAPAAPAKSFDHKVAAFPADGAHATLACASCHPAAGKGRKWIGIGTSCESCHADRVHKGSLGSACGKCHTSSAWTPTIRTVKNHLTPIAGGHAALQCVDCHRAGQHLAPQQSCSLCHRQSHGGTKVECSTCHNVIGWKQATFVHDFCTCKLPGKHQTAPCLSCHPAFRFKPTPFECAACHDKERPHEPLGACSRCHSSLSWKTRAFDHDKKVPAFPLTGKHTLLGCENCHTQKNKFRIANKECAGCHAVPTHGDFGPCAKCHSTADWKPASFDHDGTRLPLVGAHKVVACQDCHRTLAKAKFVPGPAACALCHTDPHGGQFRATTTPAPRADPTLMQLPAPPHVVSATRACVDCHTTDRWTPSTITAVNHGDFGYKLAGAHAAVDCAGCHPSNKFAGTPHACNACHVDARHHGRFGTQCEQCHNDTAWKPAARFDHARTGFLLDNAHKAVGCVTCHGGDGMKLVATAAPTACATCHAAPHGKQFGVHCADCHTTASFRTAAKFDHTRTAFPLEQRHATLPCLQCHDARQRPVVNRECRTCHGDPHRVANSIECGDCHRADRWRLIRFDHDLTGYPLVGRHRAAQCGECHTNPNWTGLRTDCIACHAFDRPRTQDHMTKVSCDDCHSTSSWRRANPR